MQAWLASEEWSARLRKSSPSALLSVSERSLAHGAYVQRHTAWQLAFTFEVLIMESLHGLITTSLTIYIVAESMFPKLE